MKRLTRKAINKAIPKGYTIEGNYNEEGCYCFSGLGAFGDTCSWECSTVWVCRLNHLTLEQWVESFNTLAKGE